MDTYTTGKSAVDPLLLFGSTTRLDDALLFVELKEQDGWRVIVRPFPFAFTNMSLQSPTGVVTGKVASEFAFLLHRFFP
jgi:hypothetical protein